MNKNSLGIDYNLSKVRYSSIAESNDSAMLFKKQITDELKDEKNLSTNIGTTIIKVADHIFDRIERLQIIRKCEVYSEAEAAVFLRLPDPEHSGRQSIRYYALTARQLSYVKIGRDGLLFTRPDLEDFLKNQKVQSYRDL